MMAGAGLILMLSAVLVAGLQKGDYKRPLSYGNNCQGPIACDFALPLSA